MNAKVKAKHHKIEAINASIEAGEYRSAARIIRTISGWEEDAGLQMAMAVAQYKMGNYEYAYHHAGISAPVLDSAEAWANLAGCATHTRRYIKAITSYEIAVQKTSDNKRLAEIHISWAGVYDILGRYDKAAQHYTDALQFDRYNRQANVGLAGIAFRHDNWGQFHNFYYRRKNKLNDMGQGMNLWQGQYTNRLLVLPEQGAGDIFQYMRYLVAAARRVENLTFLCPEHLIPLVECFPYIGNLVDVRASLTEDFIVSSVVMLMDIPGIIFKEPDYQVSAMEYLYGKRDPQEGDIGIVWRGNPDHEMDWQRSLTASDFSKYTRLYKCLSLQHRPEIDGGWDETLTKILGCRAIVSVDTGVAHLAASIGVPTALIIPDFAEWRWQDEDDATPWYPAMKIFRGRELGKDAAIAAAFKWASGKEKETNQCNFRFS